jgi:hypothetical protein
MGLPGLSISGSGTLGGTDQVTVAGTTTWSGGTMTGAGRTKVSGGLTIGTNAVTLSGGRILENPAGATVSMTANLSLAFNTTSTVENAGVWDIGTDADVTDGGGTGVRTFTNTGTLRKSAGTGVTSIGTNTSSFANTAPGSVQIQSGTIALSNGTHTGAFSISGGATLQLTGTAAFNSAASVSGAGAVSVTAGTSNFNTGTTFAPAGVTALSGGILNFNTGTPVAPGTLVISGGTLGGTDDVTVSGATTWTGGSMTGAARTKTSGGLTISTNTVSLSGARILENPSGSTATMTAGLSLSSNSPSTLENAGLWDIQNDADVIDGGGTGTRTIINTGTIRKSAGTGVTGIGSTSSSFNNTAPGSVEIQSGTLALANGTHTGSFSISGGATLQLAGTAAFNSAASVSGAGAVSVPGGTNNFNAGTTYAPAGTTTVSGGALNFNAGGSAVFTQPVSVSAGTLSLGTGAPVSIPALSLSGSGTLAGTDDVTVIGATTWAGGSMTGAARTKTSGGLTIGTNPVTLSGGRVLENPSGSTATMTANLSLSFNTSSTVENAGLWDIQNDADITDGGGTGVRTITNTGTIRKSAGSGVTGIGTSTSSFNDTAPGSVEVQSGTIALAAGTHTGSFSISGGATLQLAGTANFNSPASVTGAGALSVTGGTNTFDTGTACTPGGPATVSTGTLNFNTGAPVTLASLAMSSGTLSGADDVTVLGATSWTGGSMTGSGRTKTSGGLTIATNAVTLTGGRILENPSGSTVTMTANVTLAFNSSATIQNGGLWDIQNDADIADGGGLGTRAFMNGGTFEKSAGGGTTATGVAFSNTGSVQALAGTMHFTGGYTQAAGSTLLNGGTLSSTTTLNIQGGSLTGSGTVAANVTSSGQVAPGLSPGSLTISGNYTQSSTGATQVEIGGLAAGTEYDQLHVTGTGVATLSGTLDASFIGGFVPVDTNTFTVLTWASRGGTFSTLNLPPLPAGHFWKATYSPTSLVLEVTQDSDGDGQRDLLDCAPLDSGSFALPVETTGVAFASDGLTLSWNSAVASSGTATVKDLVRGLLGQLPAGGAGETCLGTLSGSSIADATVPAAGAGFYYLVRARNACGTATYGFASSGAERITTACP